MSEGASTPRDPPRTYRLIQGFFRFLLRLFFRRVEVLGLDNIPSDRGGVLVSWHPNGLVDPGLILTHFPGQVVFGARHGLFRWPLLGWILRSVGTVPIYRATDTAKLSPDDRQKANQGSLDALATKVAEGSFSALFPEGISHDEPHPMELKTGAARLYYRARALAAEGAPAPAIIPVGLFYDGKDLFRSNALVEFHPPLELAEELAPAPEGDGAEDAARARARALTGEIERVLADVVYATEDWETHHLMRRSRKLIRAERAARAQTEPGPPSISEKALGFARIRVGYYECLRRRPDLVRDLKARVKQYDHDLRALSIEDHELDRDPRLASWWLPVLLILQLVFIFLLLPPILLVGYLVNGPPALLLILLSRRAARLRKDEATIKLLVGAIMFPATWALAGMLGVLLHEQLHLVYPSIPNRPILAGFLVGLVSMLGGAIALRYLRVSRELARSVRVRLTRRRRRAVVGALLVERSALHDALLALAEGLPMPGAVSDDGSIVSGAD